MEDDRKPRGWSPSGEAYSHTHGGTCIRRARLLALALAAGLPLVSAGRAEAMLVSYARVQFGASSPDRVKLRGDLQMLAQPIESFPSIRIDIGTFSETIPTSALVQRSNTDGTPTHSYSYRMPSERRRMKSAGIDKLSIDLDRGRVSISARDLALKRATNPLPFRFVGGLFDQCIMLPFRERPAIRPLVETDPVTGEVHVRYVNDTTRPSQWLFSSDAPQPSCEIKDFRADKKGFQIGVPTRVRLEARVPSPSVGLLQVFLVDQNLETVDGPLCDLRDDGTNGDDIRGDRVYSCSLELYRDEPTSIRLVARGVVGGVEAVSPKVEMDVVPQLIAEDAAVFIEDLYRARDIWGEKLSQLGNTNAARQQTAAAIRALPFVRDVAFNDALFLVEFSVEDHAGILGYLPASGDEPRHAVLPPGVASPALLPASDSPATFALYENLNSLLNGMAAATDADDAVPNTKVLFWAPSYDKFFPNDEINDLRHRYATTECPSFDVRLLRDSECTLASVRRFTDYGTLILATEGNTPLDPVLLERDKILDRAPVFATGERITAVDATKEIVDLYIRDRMGSFGVPGVPERKGPRLTLYVSEQNGVVWGIRPEFINELPKRFPESVVFAGSTYSARGFKLAQSFTSAGARTFFGFNDAVSSAFVRTELIDLFQGMLDGESAAEAFAALPTTKDPASAALLQIVGDGRSTYRGLEDLFNGGFETGTLRSWSSDGDARVITRLGPYSQKDGTFMGVISTGLGATDVGGALEQTTCVPSGKHRLRFDWNFLSEEFKNYCDRGYDDGFVVTVNGAVAFRRSVDGLCSTPLSFVPGLTFDTMDDVWATGWQSADIDLAPLLGNRRTISLGFTTEDVGDSVFDTAILLDRIRFE